MSIPEFFSFLFFLFPVVHSTCPILMCGNNGSDIRFPFQLEGQTQNCSYPGFNLSCSKQSVTVLNLPHSGDFFVRSIDYLAQEIQLHDPDNCLPRRLLDFNLSGSPFMAAYYQNYSFLSCPTQVIRSRFTTIDCLSNSTNSILATSSISFARSMSTSCEIIITLPVPISLPVQFVDGFSSDLGNDLQLTWSIPDCRECEAQGGVCGFERNTSQDIGCFYNLGTGSTPRSATGVQIFRIIILSVAIPTIACAIGIAFFVCFMDRRRRGRIDARQQMSTSVEVSTQPSTVTMGLDESTIESYTKLVVGESLCLPGHNDTTCPICLSEYHTKETLKCIPECKHCFHANCIDKWLRMNSTCPVCRNSMLPTHANLHDA